MIWKVSGQSKKCPYNLENMSGSSGKCPDDLESFLTESLSDKYLAVWKVFAFSDSGALPAQIDPFQK